MNRAALVQSHVTGSLASSKSAIAWGSALASRLLISMGMKRMMMAGALSVLVAVGCVPAQQQQQPNYYAQQQPPMAGQPMAGQPGAIPQGMRQISFNGRAATEADWKVITQLEQMYRRQLPNGAYWYDAVSGAAGVWGGPVVGIIPAGLQLGGPLPANASGGGNGMLTGVFINGREIHPQDYQTLMQMLGNVYPGRWWVDAQGNAGQEGGPALLNIMAVAQQRAQASGKGGDSIYRTDGRGNNIFVGQGCAAVNAKSGDSSSSYYVGCE